MKVLLLGSLISRKEMERLNKNSNEKASVAPVNYETMLAKGLCQNGVEIEALSMAAIASFPNSIYKKIDRKRERLEDGIEVEWLPFVNIQGLKQMTVRRSAARALRRWLNNNKNITDKVVMMYSIYPPYSKPAIKLCNKFHCHLNAVIADLPEYMYTWKSSSGLKKMVANHLKNEMVKIQSSCDSYVLFTRPMAERMKIENKPYMVSEGFSDASVFSGIDEPEKYEKKTVIYAGNLSKLYGIKALVDGFLKTAGDYELHLYGAGSDASYVEKCSRIDARIKYFGNVSRKEVLTALKKAHLIVINKPTGDDYSNYSFSSKMLECMASGTPILTTRVGGMPEEYYRYVYFIDDESVDGLSKVIHDTLSLPLSILEEKGISAKEFAVNEKSYFNSTKRIVDFLEACLKG